MKKIHKKRYTLLLLLVITLTAGNLGMVQAEEDTAQEEGTAQYYESQNRLENAVPSTEPVTVTAADLILEETDAETVAARESQGYSSDIVAYDANQTGVYRTEVPQAGYYFIRMDYYVPGASMTNPILDLKINGKSQFQECKNLMLESAWKDKYQEYITDDAGNDLTAEPQREMRWQSKQMNSTIYNFAKPFLFYFEKGENTLEITSGKMPVYLGNIYLEGGKEYPDFAAYRQDSRLEEKTSQDIITIEAEKYSEKTHSYIRGARTSDQNLVPYETGKDKINILSGRTWALPNEGVSYRFRVEEAGVYYISLKYQQSVKKDMPVFKQIKIDGEYPMEELMAYAFPNTKGSSIHNETLNIEGEAIPFYFEAGEHELSLVSTAEAQYEIYEELMHTINRVNDLSLDIKVITGGKADKNRDWEIDSYLPDLKGDLEDCAETLAMNYDKLTALSGSENAAEISNLKVARTQLLRFVEDTNYLVNNLELLVQGTNSVAEYISLVIQGMLEQPLDVDRIYISTDTENLPETKGSFLYNLSENVKKFFLSFTSEEESGEIKREELNIWAARSAAHMDVLKEMTRKFEQETGIKVNLSMMPDEQKLLLAVSSGNAPDAVIGMTNYRPFDFALRGAMYDLREFEDFGEVIDSFSSEMFVPFIIEDSCYALPETANFQVLYYRKDVLEALKLEIPKTWEDVIDMLPTLSRYGMDFGTTIATAGSTKHFGATMPFIQQYEGKVYSEDGMRVELGDPKTVQAFRMMTDLYTKYSLPENIPNFFNNFKKGITPIGIADLNTYILMINAAPELAGQWGIAMSVGVENEEGEILCYQPSVATCSGIMKSSENPEAAWEFLKWYMSDETQMDYATQLQLRFGPEFIWNTANLNAMEQSTAFPEEDKEVILKQLAQTKEIPRNPAYFAVERELSNAWNMTVFDGVSPRTALDTAITKSNREITRKLMEFGYMDENGNKIKDFTMATSETVKRWKQEE